MGMQTEILQLTTLAPRRRAPFGEFLVEQRILDRFQLFRALQMQDRVPGARLGQCAVALGYIERHAIELLHGRFQDKEELIATEAFERQELDFDLDVEVVYAMD